MANSTKLVDSLNLKIVFTCSFLFFAAYITLIVYNYYQSRNDLIRVTVENQLPTQVDIIYEALSNKLNSGIAVATAYAQSDMLIDWLQGDEANPEKIANYLKRLKDELNLNFNDLQIDLIGFVSERTGNIYNTSGAFGQLNPSYDWYSNFKESDRIIDLGINPAKPGGQPYLWINKKIIDSDGNLLGINWSAYKLSQLTRLIGALQIGMQGQTFVIDNIGNIKIHKDHTAIQKDLASDNERNITNLNGVSKIAGQILGKESTATSYSWKGDKYYVYLKPLPLIDWNIVLTASENEVLAQLNQSFFRDLATGFFIFLLTTFLSLFIINRTVLKPIKDLQRGLTGFFDFLNRKTHGTQIIPVRHNDEVGKMISSINENIKNVEDRILRENELIDEINSAIGSLKNGEISANLTIETSHPELLKLRNSFNDMIHTLQMKIGHDINEIISAMDDYGNLVFSNNLRSQSGEIEKKVVVMGKQIADSVERINGARVELNEKAKLLETSNKKLEYAVKELQSFSYSVSHDLKAPLRAIVFYCEVLSKDHGQTLNGESKELLEKIVNSTKRMNDLIQDLLMLSKVSLKELVPTEINLTNVARDILNELTMSQKNPNLEVSIDDGLVVTGDLGLIRILIENLLSNALKYSFKVEKPIISLMQNGSGPCSFCLKDNGVGFNMKHANRLFEPFQRLHSQSEFEGTGIGLSIVQRIVNKHGGCITFKSEEGVGTEFFFSL